MNIKSILTSALLLTSFMTAGAQTRYLNVKIADGQYKSFEVTPDLKVTWDLENYEEKKPATTTGTAKAMIDNVETDVNWVQLWEGGPMFADHNIGAASETDYGGYYCWGGTYRNGSDFAWDGTCNNGSEVLSGNDDTATALWGADWRMPTKEELDALLTNCTCTWTDDYNGVKGLLCTGKEGTAYASNSVFFPAAGVCYEFNPNGYIMSQGEIGNYRSSTPANNYAYLLNFDSSNKIVKGDDYNCSRTSGFSVRAVYAPKPAPVTGTAKAMIDNVETDVNWVQLWEGGPKFADRNIGATSETDYGVWYAWGGKLVNKETVSNDDTNWTNDGSGNLSGNDDTATALWGADWRMPTKEEFGMLIDPTICTMVWYDGDTKKYKDTTVAGCLITGKGNYSSSGIFLPATGYCSKGNEHLQGDCGDYWSSTPRFYNYAYALFVQASGGLVEDVMREVSCRSVRPVFVK